MPTHATQTTAATRIAAALHDRTTAQITAYLNQQHTHAATEQGDAHTQALDHIARLVTALREQGIWPHRHQLENPCQ